MSLLGFLFPSTCQAFWIRAPEFPHVDFASHLLLLSAVNGVNTFYFALQQIKIAFTHSQLTASQQRGL